MGISLSNHEDRIKKLESTGYSKHTTVDLIGTIIDGRDKTYDLKRSLSEFDFIFCKQDALGEPAWRCHSSLVDILTLRDHKLACLFLSIGRDAQTNVVIEYKTDAQLRIYTLQNHFDYRLYGLKLYYNFSYNIYSLANSISFHFFKCLINSFKGGVKEIWQLV